MILIRQPAIAINDVVYDHNVAHMEIDYAVPAGHPLPSIVQDVRKLMGNARGGRCLDMVICCHGHPAHLDMGAGGFHTRDTHLFKAWRGLVERIYIRACNLAEIRWGTSENWSDDVNACRSCPREDGNGDQFCRRMARAVECTVIAPTARQYTWERDGRQQFPGRRLPFGRLDNYEGTVMWYGPQGQVLNSVEYNNWHQGDSDDT